MVLKSQHLGKPSSAVTVAPTYEKVNVWHFAQRCTNAFAEKAIPPYDQHPVQVHHPEKSLTTAVTFRQVYATGASGRFRLF